MVFRSFYGSSEPGTPFHHDSIPSNPLRPLSTSSLAPDGGPGAQIRAGGCPLGVRHAERAERDPDGVPRPRAGRVAARISRVFRHGVRVRVEPLGAELDAPILLHGHVRDQRDDGAGHRHRAVAARLAVAGMAEQTVRPAVFPSDCRLVAPWKPRTPHFHTSANGLTISRDSIVGWPPKSSEYSRSTPASTHAATMSASQYDRLNRV